MEDKKEECGVFGLYNQDDLNTSETIYTGLYMLQHRGQESAGIAVAANEDKIICHKGMGLVSEVFDDFILNNLKGNIGIGHVRYSTAGGSQVENAQPIVLKYLKGNLAIAHNGNLVNTNSLREELQSMGFMFQSTTDTEVVAALFARARIQNESLEESLLEVLNTISGAYSIVMITENKLIAARDPLGIRPLCLGKINNSYVIASESVALNPIGAEFVRDINPGEILIIDKNGIKSIDFKKDKKTAFCIFEYVYFARPDSKIDGESVYSSRLEAGRQLARECKIDADIVIGVPDSGIPAAIGYSRESKIPYSEGFVKNRYVGRTFIQPSQFLRDQSVKLKLSALEEQVSGKRVIMIDDSIVRGTTSKKIVALLKDAGAKEVHMLISSPPVKFPCYLGMDTPKREKLIANTHTIEEIREMIGADSIYFLSIEGLKKAPVHSKLDFCTACFDGDYPVEIKDKGVGKC
jgi:amidophosphoribosyltransferase